MMRGLVVALLVLLALPSPVRAADAYPSKPIHIVVPYPAGGGTDALARLVGAQLTARFGQPIVIENRPGSGTLLAADMVAKSTPDGYTLLWATVTTLGVSPVMYRSPKIDALKDFAPIAQVARATFVLVTAKSIPVKTVSDLIAYAKARPGKLDYGSAGSGTPHHLFMEMLKRRAGIDVVHVPYKGSGAATLDLVSGQLSMMIDDVTPVAGYIKSGDVRLIAVAGDQRSPLFPGVPAIGETLPGFDLPVYQAVVAPAQTSQDIVDKLGRAIAEIVHAPGYPTALIPLGMEPLFRGPADFKAFLAVDGPRWAKIVHEAGAHVE